MKNLTNFKNLSMVALVAGVVSVGGSAQAALITSTGSLSNTKIVDFSQFTSNNRATPIEVGGLVSESITLTSSKGDVYFSYNGWGLGENGTWGNGRNGYAGINYPTANITFTFNNGPVSAVGGFINYYLFSGLPSGANPLIEALDNVGNVIESYDLFTQAPISTPGSLNDGAFRGIQRATADIYGFRLSNSYAVIDDLTFTRPNVQSVPEPASVLGIFTVAGLVTTLKRRQKEEV